MNGSTIIAWREKMLPLSSRSHLPRASLEAHPYFARAYPAEKEQTLGVVTGTLLGKVRRLCPRMYAGIILISTSYMAGLLSFWSLRSCLFHLDMICWNSYLPKFMYAFWWTGIHKDAMWRLLQKSCISQGFDPASVNQQRFISVIYKCSFYFQTLKQ